MKLYVAYGSNLNVEQMAHRCQDAQIVGSGAIRDYALKYRGSKTGAYATIVPQKGSWVPVVVWKISANDERALDVYEGFPRFYYKKRMRVYLDGYGKGIYAMAYVMNDKAEPGVPSNYYLSTILTGYRENHLDVNMLFKSLEDNDDEMQKI